MNKPTEQEYQAALSESIVIRAVFAIETLGPEVVHPAILQHIKKAVAALDILQKHIKEQ